MVEEAALDNGKTLESRLPLLLQCIEGNVQIVACIVKQLHSIISEDKG